MIAQRYLTLLGWKPCLLQVLRQRNLESVMSQWLSGIEIWAPEYWIHWEDGKARIGQRFEMFSWWFQVLWNMQSCQSKRLAAVRKEDIKAREFGEVISIDIDVIPCKSVEGYSYWLDAIDHGSSWLWTSGLKNRRESEKHVIYLIIDISFTTNSSWRRQRVSH